MSCLLAYQPHVTNHNYIHSSPLYTLNTDSESALKPQYIYLDHLKHENPSILNFSESVEMPIDIPRVSIRDLDRLVAAVPSPSLLYAADGTGGASSSLPNLVVSLPTVAANEVVEISLPPVASLLPVVSLPTVATKIQAVSLPTVATITNSQSTTIAITSGSAGNSCNKGPRALTVSERLIDNCVSETRIDHQVEDDNRRVSPKSIRTIDVP